MLASPGETSSIVTRVGAAISAQGRITRRTVCSGFLGENTVYRQQMLTIASTAIEILISRERSTADSTGICASRAAACCWTA